MDDQHVVATALLDVGFFPALLAGSSGVKFISLAHGLLHAAVLAVELLEHRAALLHARMGLGHSLIERVQVNGCIS